MLSIANDHIFAGEMEHIRTPGHLRRKQFHYHAQRRQPCSHDQLRVPLPHCRVTLEHGDVFGSELEVRRLQFRGDRQVLPSENLGRDFVLPGPGCQKKEKTTDTPSYQNIDSSPIYFEYDTCCLGSSLTATVGQII
jgi:hypothetical protein